MAIVAADIKIRLSTKLGAAGDSLAGTPAGSLGKYMSQTDLVDATLENLFDNISAAEATAGDVEYRCFFIYNSHASLALTAAKVYVPAEVAGGATVKIGVDTTAASLHDAVAAQALSVADESTAPVGVSFSTPTDFASGLSLGDIPADSCIAVWVERTIVALTPALTNDGATITVQGTTAA